MRKDSQILSILAEYAAQHDWALANWPGKRVSDLRYQDVFDVDAQDILGYIEVNGWDGRVVQEVDTLPPEHSSLLGVIFISSDGRPWRVAVRKERGTVIHMGDFANLMEARRFVAKLLIKRQWTYWNHRYAREHGLAGRPLREVFDPPRGLRREEL